MGLDEQIEEREILDSIYPEEIEDVSPTEFKISILLDLTGDDLNYGPPPTLLLHVTYPKSYPDTPPELTLITDPSKPTHAFLDLSTSTSPDALKLLEDIEPTIQENIGMAMMTMVIMSLKDSAEQLVSSRTGAKNDAATAIIAKAEEEENAKFKGTVVTRDTFLAWRDSFKNEMVAAEEKRKQEEADADKKKRGASSAAKEEGKLTGKQLWERGLVGKVLDDEDDEGDVDGLESVERLKIST